MNQPVPEEKILDMIREDGRSRLPARSPRERFTLFFTPRRIDLASRVLLVSSVLVFTAVWFVKPDAFLDSASINVTDAWMFPEETVVPLEDYLDDIAKRDVLRHHLAKARPENSELPYVDSMQHITLAGIVLEDPPQAVLKDERTNSVFYVKAGAMLGEYKVVSIEEEKITLEYGDEKIDLRM
jgi:hypothetical protein